MRCSVDSRASSARSGVDLDQVGERVLRPVRQRQPDRADARADVDDPALRRPRRRREQDGVRCRRDGPPWAGRGASRPPSQRSKVSPSATGSRSSPAAGQASRNSPARPASASSRRARPSSRRSTRSAAAESRAIPRPRSCAGRRRNRRSAPRSKQRFDQRDHHQIVGAHEFDQGRIPRERAGLAASLRASLWSPRVVWQGKRRVGIVIPLEEKSAERLIEPLTALVAERHGARQPDDPVAHRLRRRDDPGGRQPPHLLGRQAAAADPDARRPRACAAIAATATSSSPRRSNSCTPRRCCTTTSSTRATCGAAQAAARVLWGNEASVLVGDFLLGQAFKMMVEVGSLPCLDVLSSAAAVIAEGEVMQLSAAKDTDDDRGRLPRRHPRQDGGAVRRGLRGRARSSPGARKPRSPPAAATAPIWASPSSSSTTRSTTAAPRPSSARTSATISARARSRCPSCCRSGAARPHEREFWKRTLERGEVVDGDLETALGDDEEASRDRGHDRARAPLWRDGARLRSSCSRPRPGSTRCCDAVEFAIGRAH